MVSRIVLRSPTKIAQHSGKEAFIETKKQVVQPDTRGKSTFEKSTYPSFLTPIFHDASFKPRSPFRRSERQQQSCTRNLMSAHAAIKAGNLAVISGGASGIGLAAAKYYLSQGMKVAIGDRSESSLQAASVALGDKGESYAGLLDVSDQTGVSFFRKTVLEKFGDAKLTVLMANAGVGGPTKASTSEGWERILSTNFYGVVNV